MALLASVFLVVSCTYVISKESRNQSVKNVSFGDMAANIEKYTGSTFIFGGFIVKTVSGPEGTWLEIVQNPADKYGNILSTDSSDGRFLALSKSHLDPLIYEKGRLITLAGELSGTKKGSIGQMEYLYPVLNVKEIYLWEETLTYPYYYYSWPSSPWWYDPWRMWYGPYYP